MFNLSLILEDSSRRYGQRTAVSFNNRQISYAALNSMANKVANGLLALGIKPGDKVALSCPNVYYFPAIYYGVIKTGAIIVPISIALKSDEIRYHLNDCEAKAYFCYAVTTDFPCSQYGLNAFNESDNCNHLILIDAPEQTLPEAVINFDDFIVAQSTDFETYQTSANDTALLIYTSATTGKAKGAELTHSNLFCNALLAAQLFDTSHRDKQLITLPLFHIFAMTVLMNAGIYRGAENILVPTFKPEAIMQLIDQQGITVFAGVPTMYWALLNCEKTSVSDESIKKNLRLCISGGAPLPVKILEDFEKRFNIGIAEGYGMSEGSPIVTFNDVRVGTKPGSIGTPVWGVEVKVIDENGITLPNGERGELIYRGHNVMKGYYKNPEQTNEVLKNGWMHSGDVAYRDEDGFFYIVDRTKDIIIRGGLNIYPREVEEVIIKHPSVSLAAVISVPDEKMGEEVKAFILLKEGMQLEEEEIISWTKSRIASYKSPRKIEFVKSLPMSATGKILKKELKN